MLEVQQIELYGADGPPDCMCDQVSAVQSSNGNEHYEAAR